MSGKRKVPVVIRRHSILAAFGDTHAGSTVGLHPNCETPLDDGGYQLLETDTLSVPDLLPSGMMHVIRHLLT